MTSIYLTENEWYQIPSVTNVDMAGNKIENLGAPAAPQDAVNKQYADSLAGGINPSQWSMFPAVNDVNMNISTITNLKPPVNIGDAANKGYVDSAASAASALWAASPASQNVNMNTSSIYNVGSLGVGTAAPSAKVEIVQDAAADCLRVLDSNADTTYFKIDSNGNVGINTGANGSATKTLNIGYGASDSNSALKFNSGANDKIFWTFYDTGPKTSILNDFVKQDDLGSLGHPNYGSQIWRTMGATDYIERMRLTNTGNLGIGTAAPTAKLEVVQDAGADCMRVLDSNADTTYFKIDSNGYVGVGMGSAALSYPLNVAGKALLIDNVAPNPELIFSGSVAGVDCLASVTARNGSSTDRSLQFYNAKNIGSSNVSFSFIGGDGTTNPAFQLLGNRNAKFYGSIDAGNQGVLNAGSLGVGTAAPSAKVEIVQDAATDAVRVLDSNGDTTYFKIDSNGFVGVNSGGSALTKALCIGFGSTDTGSNVSALKFNSGDGDKVLLTYHDDGSKISQLVAWGFQFSAGRPAYPNQGYFSWQTVGAGAFIERMKLENNGQLNVLNNKIINVGTPTAGTDAANKSYVDLISGSNSAGWSLNPALSTINAASYKIVNLGAAVNSGDAVNKAYLDSNYFNPKGGNCHYVEASIDSPGTSYTVDLGSSPFNDIFVNVCLKNGYTKNIYWTNNNNTNLQGRRVHVSVSGTSDASASGRCYYVNGSGSYYDISLNSSNRVLVFTFLTGYTGLNDWVLESSRPN